MLYNSKEYKNAVEQVVKSLEEMVLAYFPALISVHGIQVSRGPFSGESQ